MTKVQLGALLREAFELDLAPNFRRFDSFLAPNFRKTSTFILNYQYITTLLYN